MLICMRIEEKEFYSKVISHLPGQDTGAQLDPTDSWKLNQRKVEVGTHCRKTPEKTDDLTFFFLVRNLILVRNNQEHVMVTD